MANLNKLDLNKDIIIKAAEKIFSRFGFKKATMEEIAKEANKTKSAIYHYFESKEDIFNIIITNEYKKFGDEIRKVIRQVHTPQSQLRAYIVTRLNILQDLANYHSALQEKYLENYRFITKIRKEHDQSEIKFVKQILNNGVKKGIFRINDLDIAAYTLIIALKGVEYSWLEGKDISNTEKNIDNLLEMIFNGILKK